MIMIDARTGQGTRGYEDDIGERGPRRIEVHVQKTSVNECWMC